MKTLKLKKKMKMRSIKYKGGAAVVADVQPDKRPRELPGHEPVVVPNDANEPQVQRPRVGQPDQLVPFQPVPLLQVPAELDVPRLLRQLQQFFDQQLPPFNLSRVYDINRIRLDNYLSDVELFIREIKDSILIQLNLEQRTKLMAIIHTLNSVNAVNLQQILQNTPQYKSIFISLLLCFMNVTTMYDEALNPNENLLSQYNVNDDGEFNRFEQMCHLIINGRDDQEQEHVGDLVLHIEGGINLNVDPIQLDIDNITQIINLLIPGHLEGGPAAMDITEFLSYALYPYHLFDSVYLRKLTQLYTSELQSILMDVFDMNHQLANAGAMAQDPPIILLRGILERYNSPLAAGADDLVQRRTLNETLLKILTSAKKLQLLKHRSVQQQLFPNFLTETVRNENVQISADGLLGQFNLYNDFLSLKIRLDSLKFETRIDNSVANFEGIKERIDDLEELMDNCCQQPAPPPPPGVGPGPARPRLGPPPPELARQQMREARHIRIDARGRRVLNIEPQLFRLYSLTLSYILTQPGELNERIVRFFNRIFQYYMIHQNLRDIVEIYYMPFTNPRVITFIGALQNRGEQIEFFNSIINMTENYENFGRTLVPGEMNRIWNAAVERMFDASIRAGAIVAEMDPLRARAQQQHVNNILAAINGEVVRQQRAEVARQRADAEGDHMA
jgi:hypothetical protein